MSVLTNQTFSTLKEAYEWCNGQVRKGLPVQTSRVHADLFKKPRGLSGRYVKLMGVTSKAEKICKELCPGGEWRVEVEAPGTEYDRISVWHGFRTVKTQCYRFSAWYSRFLPYAYAMMKSEHSFDCMGVDFQSINSYYGTCSGFNYIGRGDGSIQADEKNGLQADYHRIVEEDCDLFDKICLASMDVECPSLPFSEALNYCSVYVALKRPDLFNEHWDKDSYMRDHVRKTFDYLSKWYGIEVPVTV